MWGTTSGNGKSAQALQALRKKHFTEVEIWNMIVAEKIFCLKHVEEKSTIGKISERNACLDSAVSVFIGTIRKLTLSDPNPVR